MSEVDVKMIGLTCDVIVHKDTIDSAVMGRVVAEIDRLDLEAEEVLRSTVKPIPSKLIVSMEAGSPGIVSRYEHILASSPIIRAFADKTVAPAVRKVVGSDVVIFKDKLNKKPTSGGGYGPHQDFSAYRHFKPSAYFTAMIAIDDMNVDNGCLEFAADYESVARRRRASVEITQHGLPVFLVRNDGSRNGDIIDDVVQDLTWRPEPLAPGDFAIFDAFVPHRSGPNISDQSRRALFLTFSRSSEGDWYQFYYERKRSQPSNPIFHVSTPFVRLSNE